ncbi:MAG: prolipoprotein diacylglyceryl transferase [Deltaproteobacteria bacterium]|nr:prolipoprotein diacylglyceryl transferase [Deltaproteobacteria bacterium]MBN2671444.1 prolipoprotein diacylglyceryl transferase [Deltaproteobacteria bacterium]
MTIPVESETHFIWMPARYVSLFGDFGVQMYDIVTVVALVVGATGWLVMTRQIRVGVKKRLLALGLIGLTTVFFTRLFHILFWGLEQNIAHPTLLVQLGHGRSIHGAVAGFWLSAFLISKLWRTPLPPLLNAISIWSVFGLVCARIGNFWNSEMVGTATTWSTGIGFYFHGDHGTVIRHPVQLYEAALALMLLVILIVLYVRIRVTKTDHRYLPASVAFIGLGIIRFCCDFIKEEPGHLFGSLLTTGQILSIPLMLLGGWLLYLPFHKRQGNR